MTKHAVSLVVALLAACGGPDDAPITQAAKAPVVVAPTATPIAGDWHARVAADVAALRAADPKLAAELSALAPERTRAGFLRFTSSVSQDPRATAVFLDRFTREADPAQRAALAEVLERTAGVYADALVELLAAEQVPAVRAVLVHTARRAPADHALAVIQRGLADGSGEVRAEAARVAASHAVGSKAATELRAALVAPDAGTRTEAARALGILGIDAARSDLTSLLADAEPDVRLEALRALDRIAPGSVAVATLDHLARDSDPRIARLATRLAETASR